MNNNTQEYDPNKNLKLNKAVIRVLLTMFARPSMKIIGVKVERYKPKADTFVLVSNHSDPLDPGFEMFSVNKYLRFVAADHIARVKFGGFLITKLGGALVKYRGRPGSEITEKILKNLKAGISVGIHAEGGTSINGETGFISEHTGQLVKDSGVALITFRFTGGYLRTPRWCENNRRGPLFGKVVAEYSAEELKNLSVKEITDIIRRDTYVNVFEDQRKAKGVYKGKDLAECVERVLFMCPSCKTVSSLHSSGDILKCDKCGYSVRYGEDAFFHDTGKGVYYDNIVDWDRWQKSEWKKIVLGGKENGEVIFAEPGQILFSVNGNEKTLVFESATITLTKDAFILTPDDPDSQKKSITIPLNEIKNAHTALKDSLLLVDNESYYEVKCKIPRSPEKYVAAWRYLTGRDYF